jgi:hypothetical protein
MSFGDPNFWASMLGGGIISAVISALISIFFGERWIEKARMRREHSLKLNKEVFEPWLEKYKEYSKVDVVYSVDNGVLVAFTPQDPELEFFNAAKSHLNSKYPHILKDWEDLKTLTYEHNKLIAKFSDDIKALLENSTKLPHYYTKSRGKAPDEYISHENIFKMIYQAISDKIRTGYESSTYERITPTQERKEFFYVLTDQRGNCLVKSRNENEAKDVLFLTKQIIESPEHNQRIECLLEMENKTLQTKRESFENKMKELIASIELGKSLEGKCKFCP